MAKRKTYDDPRTAVFQKRYTHRDNRMLLGRNAGQGGGWEMDTNGTGGWMSLAAVVVAQAIQDYRWLRRQGRIQPDGSLKP